MVKDPDPKPNVISLDQRRPALREILDFIKGVRTDLDQIATRLGLINDDAQPHNICHASLTEAVRLEKLAHDLRGRVNDFAIQHGEAAGPSRNRVVATRVTPDEAAAIHEQERREAGAHRELAIQARLLFDNGRGDIHKAMSLLAQAFPALSRAEGVEPFDAWVLAEWAKSGKSHGEICAAKFILSVWNTSKLRDGTYGLAYFDLHEALGVWDRHHQQAFAGWAEQPWWP